MTCRCPKPFHNTAFNYCELKKKKKRRNWYRGSTLGSTRSSISFPWVPTTGGQCTAFASS